MTHLQRLRGLAATCSTLGLLALAGAAQAQIQVTPSVTFASGLYTYDYTVVNNSSDDVFDIAINVTPGVNTVQNLSVPVGFMSAYDSNLGIVDFISDTSLFGVGTTQGGFMFDSPLAPGPSSFAALTLNGTVIGTTQSAVPEPGLPALLAGCGVFGLMGWRTARRRRAVKD